MEKVNMEIFDDIQPDPEKPKGLGSLPYQIELRDIMALVVFHKLFKHAGLLDVEELWAMAYHSADCGLRVRALSPPPIDDDIEEEEESEVYEPLLDQQADDDD